MVSRMASNLALILSIILISATSIASFDITKMLQKYSDFSNFNDLLTQTGLADNINNRQTITVLVVDNSGMSSITSKPQDVARKILATHVILDFYDTKKLGDMPSNKNQSTMTTIFQTTGTAVGSQGFLTVTSSGNDVFVGSAVNGAPHDSKVLKSIESQPYNISVIQISQPIMTPGLDHITPASSPKQSTPAQSPKKASTPAPSPKKAHKGKAPSPSDDDTSRTTSPTTSPASSPGPAGGPASSAADDDVADKKKVLPTTNEGARMTSIRGVTVLASMGLVAWAL